MKKKNLLIAWAGMFAASALLGFLPEPDGLLKALMVLLSLAFFVPGGLLLWRGDRQAVRLVRNLSMISLGATLVCLIVNLLSVQNSRVVGDVLNGVLVGVSAPMVCSQFWGLSLFLWACLMVTAISKLKKTKNPRN